uniref:Potassium channel tetramerisation-type BTB domain-containing protein n=1 Tax=Parascaris univalens TaxID=6257 RepID=A0A915C265_PARUN
GICWSTTLHAFTESGTLVATSHGIRRINRHNRANRLSYATQRLGRYLRVKRERLERSASAGGTFEDGCAQAADRLFAEDESTSTTEVITHNIPSNQFLRLNVGGIHFLLRANTVNERRCGRLYWMLRAPHEQRLTMVDAYFDDVNEYYFERPPLLFHVIYQFYLTGLIHQPTYVCPQDLLDELDYWDIVPDTYLASCCCADQLIADHQSEDDEECEKPNYFKNLRCGEYRRKVWNLIEEPSSSTAAQIFAAFSVLFLLISICGLVLGSLPELQVPVLKQNSSGLFSFQ